MTDSTPMKTCTKCDKTFPATPEYFHRTTKGDKFGLIARCKTCQAIISREHRERNRDALLQSKREYYQQNKEQHAERTRKYYQENKEQIHELTRQWVLANPEKRAEITRRYRETHKEQISENSKRYREENKELLSERYRAKYPFVKARIAERNRRWQDANPEKRRTMYNRRRARVLSLPDTLTHEQWQSALDYFNGCCAVCGRQLKDLFGTHTVSQDHWIPVSADNCPGTTALNIIPLCHGEDGCNNSKHANMPDVWLIRKYGERKAKQILERIETYFMWVKTHSIGEWRDADDYSDYEESA